MCTKPFSQTKNKGKQFLVAKSIGPLLVRMPLKWRVLIRISSKILLKIVAYNNRWGHYFSKHVILIN